MRYSKFRSIVLACICIGCSLRFSSAQTGTQKGWTDTEYPSFIKRLNYFGERADWSHDGKHILFVGKTFGQVFEMNIETGVIKPLTNFYHNGGYLRALYLSNGDILLVGPKDFSSDDWREARFRRAELWLLSKKLDSPPVRLGEYAWEGPAVSRSRLKIAWAEHHGVYPAQKRYWQIWVADIDYASGKPQIMNQRVVLDNAKGEVKGAVLEPQNFRPGNEDELIFQSSHAGTEVMGLNLKTGKLVNYSKSPHSYDEPEGIFPDGQYTLVESDRARQIDSKGSNIDIWRLKLDTTGTWKRITHFNQQGTFKATNPVISDDGHFMAFQVSRVDEVAGTGHGIYLLDLPKFEREMNAAK